MWQQTFTYDVFGNITKAGSSIFNPGYNGNGILNNRANTFTYDADGNVLNDGGCTHSYDVYGRSAMVGGTSVTYDALGRAVQTYDGSNYGEILYSPSGQKFAFMNGLTLQQYTVPMAGGAQVVYNASGLAYYRHSDWLGSSRMASTSSYPGTVYYDGAYAPFGESYAETGTTDRSFTGQTQDTTQDTPPALYDFLFRQQSAVQGRWMVPDPAGLAAVDITNPQTWNRYAYVANNPLNAVDPMGLYLEVCPPDYYGGDCSLPPGGGGIGIPCWWCDGGGGGGGHHHPPPSPPPPGPPPAPPPQPINFPNETNGIPNGLPTNPWGIWGAIIPTAQCGDIACPPIGSTFNPALAAPICVAAPEVCILGGIGLTIYAIAKFGPPLIHLIEDASSSSDLTKDKMQVCVYSGEFEDSHVDPQYKICSYSCSDGHARTVSFPRASACPKTQWFPK